MFSTWVCLNISKQFSDTLYLFTLSLTDFINKTNRFSIPSSHILEAVQGLLCLECLRRRSLFYFLLHDDLWRVGVLPDASSHLTSISKMFPNTTPYSLIVTASILLLAQRLKLPSTVPYLRPYGEWGQLSLIQFSLITVFVSR